MSVGGTRVAVFLDYQNVYMGARRCFGGATSHVDGQVHPRRLGLSLCERGRAHDPTRTLQSVNIYRGDPSPKRSPSGASAAQRQVAAWRSLALVNVFTRPLKYYPDGSSPAGESLYLAREKGIDVLLALGMVVGAMGDEYDVAILFSADTDLLPAVEAVRAVGKRVEVAGWRPDHGYGSSLTSPGMWCHWLDRYAYEGHVHDPTNYRFPQA